MRFSDADKWVLTTIGIALVIDIVSSRIGDTSPLVPIIATVILVLGLVVYALVRVAMLAINYYLNDRFAILVFVLDDKDRLLLYRHPHFQRHIPPGGRLALSEAPDVAVKSRLATKAGITAYFFDPHFHAPRFPISEKVEEAVRPFGVHWEHRRQRGGVRSHYSFIYVCRIAEGATAGSECRWVTLDDLREMDVHTRPFDDIIAKYQQILTELQSEKSKAAQ
jgi:hypothetical protein